VYLAGWIGLDGGKETKGNDSCVKDGVGIYGMGRVFFFMERGLHNFVNSMSAPYISGGPLTDPTISKGPR